MEDRPAGMHYRRAVRERIDAAAVTRPAPAQEDPPIAVARVTARPKGTAQRTDRIVFATHLTRRTAPATPSATARSGSSGELSLPTSPARRRATAASQVGNLSSRPMADRTIKGRYYTVGRNLHSRETVLEWQECSSNTSIVCTSFARHRLCPRRPPRGDDIETGPAAPPERQWRPENAAP